VVGPRPISESVLIIGPAVDGPIDKPVRVSAVSEIEAAYGPVRFNSDYVGPSGEVSGFNGNFLMKALREVRNGGAVDVRVMRVGGSFATGTFTNAAPSTGTTGTITVVADNPGRIYNQASLEFTSGATGGQMILRQPTSKGGDVTVTWGTATSGLTIGELIDRINGHGSNRTVTLAAGTIALTGPARNLQGSVTLAGGTDGTIKDDLVGNKYTMYDNLTAATTGTFALLDDYNVDIVYIAGLYLDDQVASSSTSTSIAGDFSAFLGQRTLDNPMIGVIGIRPLDNINNRTKVIEHFNALTTTAAGNRATNWLNAGYFMYNGFPYDDANLEQPIDAGGYLQVVAADVVINDVELGLYVESAAGLYAGLLGSLKPHKAPTHKRVPGIFGLPYEFTAAQLNTLVGGIGRDANAGIDGGGAYVTVRRIDGQGILFTRGVTAAQRTSDFKNLQPLRIANGVHKGVKEIAFPFLGEANDLPHKNALETSIKTFLDTLYEAGAILGKDGIGYTVRVTGGSDNPMDQLLGRITIDITLRPALEILEISVRVRLSL
jgi:hypothetical protein